MTITSKNFICYNNYCLFRGQIESVESIFVTRKIIVIFLMLVNGKKPIKNNPVYYLLAY